MDLVVVIHRAEEGGYWAEFPSLDGCFVQGETIDALLADAPAAAASHIEALKADSPCPPLMTYAWLRSPLPPSPEL